MTSNTYSSAVHAIATVTAIGLTACAALCAPPARADAVGLRTIAVDATVPIGAMRPLSGVNGAPAAEFGRQAAGEADAAAGVDGAVFYRDARIDLVRIHNEFGPGDVDAIFPDMNADPDNPKSYDFAQTDRLITSIKGAGAEPLLRNGRADRSANARPRACGSAMLSVQARTARLRGWPCGTRTASSRSGWRQTVSQRGAIRAWKRTSPASQ